MLAAECEFFKVDVAFVLVVFHDDLVVFEVCALLDLVFLCEREFLGFHHDLVEVVDGDFVIGVEDEAVFRTEVPGDSEFRFHVVLHLVAVAVEVVRGNVRDDGDVRSEVVAVVQLETTDFQYVIVEMLRSDLICVALADVAAESHVEAGFFQEIVYQ